MGVCNCSNFFSKNKNFETQNEMTEGSLPNDKISEDVFSPIDDQYYLERLDNYKKRSETFRNNKTKVENMTSDSEFISINQERNDLIFEFYNNLRIKPQNFLKEAEKYDLVDLIQSSIDNTYNENISHLIKNPFYNLLFESIINKVNGNKDEIMDELNEDSQIKNYKKKLFVVESTSNEPNKIIWKLLQDNKDIALREILYSKIDYLIIATNSVPYNNQVNSYFLFLKR